MNYLDNAPPLLIALHKERTRGETKPGRSLGNKSLTASKVLEILLSDQAMTKAWRVLSKSLVNKEDYEKFYDSTVEAMRLARRDIADQTERRKHYRTIAEIAEKLSELIVEPDRTPAPYTAYRGELDLRIYELFPEDVAHILGAQSWSTMKSEERTSWARSLLHAWPTIVEVLKQLAVRARCHEAEPVSSVKRSRRFLPEETEQEILSKTKARLFCCHLYDKIRIIDNKFNGLAAIKIIASRIYDVDVNSGALKKAISDHSKKMAT